MSQTDVVSYKTFCVCFISKTAQNSVLLRSQHGLFITAKNLYILLRQTVVTFCGSQTTFNHLKPAGYVTHQQFNRFKPTGHVMNQQFNIQQL